MRVFDKPNNNCEIEYKAFLRDGGSAVLSDKCKYIGGHPGIKGERKGELAVNNAGVFFKDKKNSICFYLPVMKILRAGFETGETVAKNAVFSRFLAVSGFIFAYKRKTREKHMFLVIDYIKNGVENAVLLETQLAGEFASVIAKIRQEANEKKQAEEKAKAEALADNKLKPEQTKTISELIIEINQLRALGILSIEEFNEKKRELLSRI